MSDFDLKEYTNEEYEADMKAKLKELGLYKAVKHYEGTLATLKGIDLEVEEK